MQNMKDIEIPDILDVLSAHFKMSRPDVFKVLKKHFSTPDKTTLYGVFFELLKHNIKPEIIIKSSSEYFDVPVDDMKSPLRKREVTEARQIAMYFIDKLTNLSLKANGKMFGGRDHTTVIYAKQTVEDLMETDPQYKRKLIEAATLLLGKFINTS